MEDPFKAGSMKKRFSLPFYLILFFGGLVFGIGLGIYFGGGELPEIIPQIPNKQTPTPVISGQQSLLIVGVDRINLSPARLQGVWYVAYLPTSPVVTLIPLYPTVNQRLNKKLEENFELERSNRLGREFTEVLYDSYNFDWDTQILLDDFAMIAFIDLLGGIKMANELQNGSKIVGEIPSPSANPQQALDGQIAVIRGLCEGTNRLETSMDLSKISATTTLHLAMQVDLETAYTAFSDLLATGPSLTCNIVDFRSN